MKKFSEVKEVKEIKIDERYPLHPAVSNCTGTFMIATRLGFVIAQNCFDRDVRKAKTFSTWNEANEFAKTMFPKYWAIVQA